MVLQPAKAAHKGFDFFSQLGLVAQALHPGQIDGQRKQGGLAVAQVLGLFLRQIERQQQGLNVFR